MYLISGQTHLRLQPAVALVATHTKLRLYTVQCMVGKNAFVPQISVGKGAEGLLPTAVGQCKPFYAFHSRHLAVAFSQMWMICSQR